MANALNYKELREKAQRCLPKGIFEYIDRGSEDETALMHTRDRFDSMRFAPRALVTGPQSTKVSLFGEEYQLPLIAAPTAFTGLVWYRGEIELARAAREAGIPYCAATAAITSLEDIASVSSRPGWFQLYLWEQGELWRDLVERAWNAGVKTLVLTVDTNISPNREFNIRNGFGVPLRFGPRNILDVALHPRWATGVLLRYLANDGWPSLANYPEQYRADIRGKKRVSKLSHHPDLGWDHVRQLRDMWKGNLVIKGILRSEDALLAADYGADGIVVSSHGARNIDSSLAPLDVLPSIVEAAGERLTVLADSGVQRGSDVFKLLSLGAKAVLVGRAFLYGTAIGGEAGARHAIDILHRELSTTMTLAGYRTIEQIRQANMA